ncbi:MAG: hypothetical protein M3137_08910 [Actinomycetota bacterium]|nr:hypothetical protein [Actinomycetota bacterium]
MTVPRTNHQGGPERYVRLLLEEALAHPHSGRSPLAALKALAGAGLLDDPIARNLQTDMALALALRDDDGPTDTRPSDTRPSDIAPCMVAVGPATIDLPGASLHVDAIVSDGVTTGLEGRLVIAGLPGAATERPRLDALSVTDDAGTAYALTPRSEPGPDGFAADLHPPVPADASWVELSGGNERPIRLALSQSPIGPIDAQDHGQSPVEHYLSRLVTTRLALLLVDGSADRVGDAGPALDALVAAGAVSAGAPLALQAARIDDLALGFDAGTGIDPQILAVLSARDRIGRRGVWPVLSPPAVVDGVMVRIDVVTASPAHVRVLGVCRPWPAPLDVPLSFTATDDVGGWYAGVAGDGDGAGTVSWALVPALDPAAGELTVTVSGPHQCLSVVLELT